MNDYLQLLCSQNKIKLIYTDNDYTILSSGISSNIPVLRAYHMFKKCPEKIAYSILQYYKTNNEKHLRKIEDYIDDDLFFLGYQIEPPDKMFLQLVNADNRKAPTLKEMKKDESVKESTALVEADIVSITEKDFYSNKTVKRSGQVLKASSDTVSELDVVIRKE